MASNDIEVLDPAATVEKLKKVVSGVALNRRHFMAALGAAGIAAGTELVTGRVTHAQQPTPNGYQQVDVLNYLLNIKYLTATFYSYLTQGADLPAATYATLATGIIYNQPSKVTFTTQTQTDLFNEMYYDELNQVIDLRNLVTGSLSLENTPVINRPTMSLQGLGTVTAAASPAYTAATAIAQARMLEDTCVTAFTGALSYLSGANLTMASQCLAISGQHASALRLLSIQSSVPYQRTQLTTTLQVGTTSGSPTVIAIGTLTTNILVGANILGTGIPTGTVITALTSKASATFSAIATSGSNTLTSASSVALAAVGQPVTGTGIPTNTVMTQVGVTTITMSANATASSTATATAITVSGSNVLNTVSSVSSVIVGTGITGTNIPASTTITATSSTSTGNTVTMSAPATASSLVASFTGNVTSGSTNVTITSPTITGYIVGQAITGTGIPAGTTVQGTGNANIVSGILASGSKTISSVSSTAGLIAGQPITAAAGTGIPSGATISSFTANTITLSAAATINSTNTFTGIVTSGSASITGVASLTGLAVGQTLTGTGIASGATISSTTGTSAPYTVVMSKTATANSTTAITGLVTSGSTTITGVSSISAVINGQTITGTNIPSGTTVVSSSGTTITMSKAATASYSVTVTGIVTNGSTSITYVSSFTGVAVGQTITGPGIPTGTTVVSTSGVATNPNATIVMSNYATATSSGAVSLVISETESITLVGTAETITYTGALAQFTVPPYILTLSQAATATGTNVALTTPALVTVTFPATETVTTGQSILSISQNATATASSTASIILSDPYDSAAADPGTAALAAAGPAPSTTILPVVNQGFYNTAGANNSTGTNPQGFAFARTFSQVLAVLYANTTPATKSGGFFSVGVNGKINAV
ncbi:MAG: ferritin-like domain-containing protein [Terracidiphilus sp.]